MSLLGERVAVSLPGGGNREGILLNGRKKQTSTIQQFVVRFKDGDIRTYRGDQLQLMGERAGMEEFIKEGDVLFTKRTLGVCRFIGEIQGVDPAICLEAIDPRLPNVDNINFRELLPDANLATSRSYAILKDLSPIKKIVPPEHILGMLSRIKDKYIELTDTLKNNPPPRVASPREPQKAKEAPAAQADDSALIFKVFQSTRLGLSADWTTGVVEQIVEEGQAKDLGVMEGWVITSVNGKPYTEDLLDAALAGPDPIELAFDTSMAQEDGQESEGPEAAIPDVVSVAKGEKETDETQDASVPMGVAATTLQELNALREENSSLHRTLKQQEERVKILQAKNQELLKESEELNRVRIKVDQLRNGKKAFSEQIKNLEREKEAMLRDLEDKRTAHAHTAEQLRIMSEENHRLIKKYKKVKRRASKSMPRQSNMRILRGNSQGQHDAVDGDDESGSVLHEYISSRVQPSDEPHSGGGDEPDSLANLKEKDFKSDGGDPADMPDDINAGDNPDEDKKGKKKKKGKGWFSRGRG